MSTRRALHHELRVLRGANMPERHGGSGRRSPALCHTRDYSGWLLGACVLVAAGAVAVYLVVSNRARSAAPDDVSRVMRSPA